MNSHLALFEIPATDFNRAIRFYHTIFDFQIEEMEMPEMQMGVLPYENQMVTGLIIKAQGYKPSSEGVTIYFQGGDDLQTKLDKVEINGGRVLIQKTRHADESGYFAVFLDSEGNKIGLNSPN